MKLKSWSSLLKFQYLWNHSRTIQNVSYRSWGMCKRCRCHCINMLVGYFLSVCAATFNQINIKGSVPLVRLAWQFSDIEKLSFLSLLIDEEEVECWASVCMFNMMFKMNTKLNTESTSINGQVSAEVFLLQFLLLLDFIRILRNGNWQHSITRLGVSVI